MFVVFYTDKNYNQFKTYYQASNRKMRSVIFDSKEQAEDFAKNKNNAEIYKI